MYKSARISLLNEIDIYPVTCEALSAGRTSVEILDGLLAGGARIVQLREKDLSVAELYELALVFRGKTREAGALLIVNDHLDLALAVEADGVHLGQDDLPLAAARRIAPDLLLGRSTHNLAQALAAQEQGADYVNLGPIYPTKTKTGHSAFLGPDGIRQIMPSLHIPFTVMGGINENNLDAVLAAGARRIAVVTAVTQAPDVAGAVRQFRRRILAANEAYRE
jgi:thiamine-phosphate pyrophosphorylase